MDSKDEKDTPKETRCDHCGSISGMCWSKDVCSSCGRTQQHAVERRRKGY